MKLSRGVAILALMLLPLGGCSAVSAVSGAATPLDAYTLSPLPAAADARQTGRHLVVEVATASGAIATDRILIKPNTLQAQYLPGGRWVDPAPVLIQSLLVASLQNQGGFRRVGRDGAGLLPDFTLLTDLREFQVEPARGAVPQQVRVAAVLTLVRESDRSLAASRRVEATAPVSADTTLAQVAAFDAAMRQVLGDAVAWTLRTAR